LESESLSNQLCLTTPHTAVIMFSHPRYALFKPMELISQQPIKGTTLSSPMWWREQYHRPVNIIIFQQVPIGISEILTRT
jgi:hypothetical protein